jgi:hypothetical protein
MALVFGGALLVAFLAFPGFFPPMSPSMSAADVAAFYRDNQAGIRFSMIVFNLCGCMLLPFFMVIVYQMKRMGTPSQVLAYAFLCASASGATLLAIADLFWLVGAFRPERDPQLIQLLNDLAWITFTAPVGMIVAQMLCLALAIYLDEAARPIFPRWVAHVTVCTAVAMAPACAAAAVTSGPLAWNGAISFWLRIAGYSTFLVMMFVVLRRAIRREEAEPVAPRSAPAAPLAVSA